jgi:hypothetical protein
MILWRCRMGPRQLLMTPRGPYPVVRKSLLRTCPEISAANRDRCYRTGCEAGPAAGAQVRCNFGQRATADAWREANGAGVAEVAANTAFDTLVRQTGRADGGLEGPWQALFCADQCAGFTGVDAGATESAFTVTKIDSRKTAVARHDDVFRADTEAVVAARAGVGKRGLGERPRRANFSLRARSTAKESPATGVDHLSYLPCFILSMPLRSNWSISEPGSTCGNNDSQ